MAIGGTILQSAARTTSTNAADVNSLGGGTAVFFLDITATPNNAETLTPKIQFKDPASLKYVTVSAFTALLATDIGAISTTSTYIYTVGPGAAETAAVGSHELQALTLPEYWRFIVTHSSTGSWTYSLSFSQLAQ